MLPALIWHELTDNDVIQLLLEENGIPFTSEPSQNIKDHTAYAVEWKDKGKAIGLILGEVGRFRMEEKEILLTDEEKAQILADKEVKTAILAEKKVKFDAKKALKKKEAKERVDFWGEVSDTPSVETETKEGLELV